MKRLLFISMFIGLTACEQRQFDTTDPVFDPYVEQFKKDHLSFKNKKIDFDVAINFSNNIGDANANCYIYKNDKNEILVNPFWFNKFSEASKKALIYHELGHCALKQKEHRNEYIKTKISSSMKASIMNSSASGTLKNDEQNVDDINGFYLYELFNQDQSIWEQF